MRHSFNAFSAGETSDLLDDRSDLTQVQRSLKTLCNAELTRYGALDKRSGTEDLGAAGNNVDVRMEPFEFSAFTKFQLEFGAGYIRFWSNRTQVRDSVGAILSVATPYTVDDLFGLQFKPVNDWVYITHENHQTRILKRVADNEWTIDPFAPVGPYIAGDDDIKITIIGEPISDTEYIQGEVGLTSDADYFEDPEHVDEKLRVFFKQKAFSEQIGSRDSRAVQEQLGISDYNIGDAVYYIDSNSVKNYYTCIATWLHGDHTGTRDPAAYPLYWERGERLWGPLLIVGKWDLSSAGDYEGEWILQTRAKTTDDWGNTLTFTSVSNIETPQFSGGQDEATPVYMRVLLLKLHTGQESEVLLAVEEDEMPGLIEIDSVEGPKAATGTVIGVLYDNGEVTRFEESAWSDRQGYPRVVGFNETRLIFAGTTKNPLRIWYSEIDNFSNFLKGTFADSPFWIDAIGEDYSAVQWLATREDVFMGTASSEGTLIGRDREVTVSAENLPVVNWFSSEGNAYVPAVFLNASWFALQAGRTTIHEFKYSLERDRFQPEEATLLHENILASGVRQMDVRREPEKALLATKIDGTLVGFTHKPAAQMAGWWRFETEGTVMSHCVTRGDGEEDEVTLAVKRNGSIRIEHQSLGNRALRRAGNQHQCNYLDGATVIDATGGEVSEVSELTRFASAEVTYLADGIERTGMVSAAGVLTLQDPAEWVIVGQPYEMLVEPHSLETFTNKANSVSRRKQITEATASFWLSVGGEMQTDGGKWWKLNIGAPMTTNPLGGKTHGMVTDMRKISIDQKTGRKKTVRFRSRSAYPFTLLGLYSESETMRA